MGKKKPPAKKKPAASRQVSPTTKKERVELAKQRRERIRSLVMDERNDVTLDWAMREFGVSRSALYNDLEFFSNSKLPISIDGNAFRYDEDHLRTVHRRKSQEVEEKEAIGRIAATLAVGQPSRHRGGVADVDDVERLISSQKSNIGMPFELRARLGLHFKRAHKLLILDAGTTLAATARHLAQVHTPSPEHRLASLRILTNGRTVADELDLTSCSHEIILLGGALRKDTEAIAGTLSDMCLDAWNTRAGSAVFADMSIIGATNFDTQFNGYCDHEIEAATKARLLSSGRVRCLAVAASKVIECAGGWYPFCKCDSAFVDIVITDWRILESQSDGSKERNRTEFLRHAKEAGIYVLIGQKE